MTEPVSASMPTATCPQCHTEVEDFDGFGVLEHLKPEHADGCGYCSHYDCEGTDSNDVVCRLCGAHVPIHTQVSAS